MSKEIYLINCEWDIGQGENFFETEKLAVDFATRMWDSLDMEEEINMSLKEAVNYGLLSISTAILRQ